jgi:hypothetical protein
MFLKLKCTSLYYNVCISKLCTSCTITKDFTACAWPSTDICDWIKLESLTGFYYIPTISKPRFSTASPPQTTLIQSTPSQHILHSTHTTSINQESDGYILFLVSGYETHTVFTEISHYDKTSFWTFTSTSPILFMKVWYISGSQTFDMKYFCRTLKTSTFNLLTFIICIQSCTYRGRHHST